MIREATYAAFVERASTKNKRARPRMVQRLQLKALRDYNAQFAVGSVRPFPSHLFAAASGGAILKARGE